MTRRRSLSARGVLSALASWSVAALLFGDPAQAGDDLEREKELLRGGTVEEKCAALEAIAEAAKRGEPPSKELGRLIASALGDGAADVRRQAARLLGEGQHPEVALPALGNSLEELRQGLAKLGRPGRRSGEDREKLQDLVFWGTAVVEALGSLRDDRSVDALVGFAQRIGGTGDRRLHVQLARALLKLECQRGIEAVIRALPQIEAVETRREGRLGAAPGPPGEQLHEMLTELARSKGLEGMPAEWTKSADSEWRAWFAKNRAHFPAKLGRLTPEGESGK
ncbi:MAG: hypothetical protein AB1486_28680 [Planctomycetota bacterium]